MPILEEHMDFLCLRTQPFLLSQEHVVGVQHMKGCFGLFVEALLEFSSILMMMELDEFVDG